MLVGCRFLQREEATSALALEGSRGNTVDRLAQLNRIGVGVFPESEVLHEVPEARRRVHVDLHSHPFGQGDQHLQELALAPIRDLVQSRLKGVLAAEGYS